MINDTSDSFLKTVYCLFASTIKVNRMKCWFSIQRTFDVFLSQQFYSQLCILLTLSCYYEHLFPAMIPSPSCCRISTHQTQTTEFQLVSAGVEPQSQWEHFAVPPPAENSVLLYSHSYSYSLKGHNLTPLNILNVFYMTHPPPPQPVGSIIWWYSRENPWLDPTMNGTVYNYQIWIRICNRLNKGDTGKNYIFSLFKI